MMSCVAYVIEFFFDGGCPLCRRETNFRTAEPFRTRLHGDS